MNRIMKLITDETGEAQFAVTISGGTPPSTYNVSFTGSKENYASSPTIGRSYIVAASPKLTIASLTPETQTSSPGQSVTFTITMKDGTGAPVSGVAVTGSDYLASKTFVAPLTDTSGVTSYTTAVPVAAAPGKYTLSFSASKIYYEASPYSVGSVIVPVPVTHTLTISNLTPTATQTLIAGQSVTYAITVKDETGAPVSGVIVTGPAGFLGKLYSTPVTDATGVTSYTATVPGGTSPGTYTLGFSGSKQSYTESPYLSRIITVPPP
jgi:methionine-rich copper-binding protein CopC